MRKTGEPEPAAAILAPPDPIPFPEVRPPPQGAGANGVPARLCSGRRLAAEWMRDPVSGKLLLAWRQEDRPDPAS